MKSFNKFNFIKRLYFLSNNKDVILYFITYYSVLIIGSDFWLFIRS